MWLEHPPFPWREERGEPRHVLRAPRVERLLPVSLKRIERRPVEVPDRVVAEELAGRAREHGLPGLAANLIRRRVVLALVDRFDQHERSRWRLSERGDELRPE